MRLKASIIGWAAVFLAGATTVPAQAANFVNGSFEDGFDGWTTDEALVQLPFQYNHRDSGGLVDQPYDPVDGWVFAEMQAAQDGVFVRLSQTFTTAGGVFSGWAAFLGEDAGLKNDSGYVRIFDASTSRQLFFADITGVGDYGFTPWTQFSTVLSAGEYTVEAGIRNVGDGLNPSFLLLDGLNMASVPEPASWALMLAGFLGVGALMRRRAGQVQGRVSATT